jgi:hypothetical protein
VIPFRSLKGAKKIHIYQIFLLSGRQKEHHDLETLGFTFQNTLSCESFQDTGEELAELSTPTIYFVFTPRSQLLIEKSWPI